jgi:hypothetical protein
MSLPATAIWISPVASQAAAIDNYHRLRKSLSFLRSNEKVLATAS